MRVLTGTSHIAPQRAPRLAAVGLFLALGLHPISAASVAGPVLPSSAVAALARLQSYQVQLRATSQGAQAATFVRTAIVVRAGAQTAIDIVSATRPQGAGEVTISEVVIRGATVCDRVAFNTPLPLSGAFTCRRAPAQATALTLSLEPMADLLPLATRFSDTYTRGGTSLRRGARCDTYLYNARATTAVERGVLYLDHTTGVPCDQEATTIGAPVIGLGPSPMPKGTATTTAVTTWSRLNDPTLLIPRTPGS